MSERIDPEAPLAGEIRRIAAKEIEAAVGCLADVDGDTDKALHETRKRLKSLRALLRLMRAGDDAFARAENARYRDAARLLAGPREAGALLETLDRLEQEFPAKTEGGALDPVRAALDRRRENALGQDLGPAVAAAADACRAGRVQIETLTFDSARDAAILGAGVRDAKRQARKALGRAAKRGTAADFHGLRKATKIYARYLSLLGGHWPTPVKARRKSFDALNERLGELHDIFVLRGLLRTEPDMLDDPGDAELLDRLCTRSERRLSKACLGKAAKLLRPDPRTSAKALARAVRRSRQAA
ncbi:CHAD domain-containing protein [Mesorhizobium marinum]|uniref:CHAD domain-containing protein n=1 Tax=Mesorhizobium marinum TaxID=3228790 RepID=UPI003466D7C9